MMPLVLIPGVNNTPAVWDGVRAALGDTVATITVSCPAVADVDLIADALLATLPAQFDLCGFSFGGYVAMAMLAKAPGRVRDLVLLCSTSRADSADQRAGREASVARAEGGEHIAMVDAQARFVFHPDSLANPAMMAARAAMTAEYGAARFIAHQRASAARPDRTALLRDGTRRVLLLAASADRLFPPDTLRDLAGEIPGAELRIIDRAGHMAPLEQPTATATALRDWLRA